MSDFLPKEGKLISAIVILFLMFACYLVGKRAADRWYAEHYVVGKFYGTIQRAYESSAVESGCIVYVLPRPQTACVVNDEIRFDIACVHPIPVRP